MGIFLSVHRLKTGNLSCDQFQACRSGFAAIPPVCRGKTAETQTMAIKRALLSVSDKSGLLEFAQGLHGFGVELLSTGGTAKALRDAGLPVLDVADYTGAPELFEGRVKTLHPKVHGGLLQKRDSVEHRDQAERHGIPPIDLVVVNLYPFEQTVSRDGVTLEEAIENIDIGGPSMLRSASKNYASVTVVCDPKDYPRVLEQMAEFGGDTALGLREELAVKVFLRTSEYDAAIGNYLGKCKNGTRCHLTISVILKRLKKALLQHLPINKLKPMPGMLLGIWEVMIICYKARRLIVFIHRCNAKQS